MMKLEDVCVLIADCPHSTAPDEGSGFPLIRTPNIGKGRLILEGVHRVSENVYHLRNKRAVPQDDDLIFAREATAGNVAIIKNGEKVCLGQRTVLLRPNKEMVDPDFLVYFLLAPEQQYGLLGTANGATVAHVNIPTIRNLKISLPPLTAQRKIAAIIKSYDDLIENNQNQIKLLEEAAQRLYKEWFVDLRFPGHENTPIVDGVPEGWSLTNINAVMTFHRGYDLTKNSMIPGKYPVIGSTSIIGYHNQYKIKGPGIVTGRSGSLGEYQLTWEDYWPHNTALYVSDMKGHHVLYLYSMLQTVDFSGLNNGGAIPTLNRNTLSNIAVIEATKALQDEYVRIVEPFYSSIRTAKKQIEYLQETRDRLLPKLMNGEIEVL